MRKPAARLGDQHTCPIVDPGPKPHVGGPITGPCAATVLVGGIPLAQVGSSATCAGPPDAVASGSATVRAEGRSASRLGDSTAHGGVIVAGNPTVLIGGAPPPTQAAALKAAATSGKPFCEL